MSRRGPTASAVLAMILVAAAAATTASAEPLTPPKGTKPAPARPKPAASAIESLARSLAEGLGPLPRDARIVGAPLVADGEVPRRDALVARVLTQLATVTGAPLPDARPLPLAEARAAAGNAPLVHVTLEIAKGALRATADVHPVVDNAWDRLRERVPPPTAHAFASAPLDAEVRSYMTPILLERVSAHRAKHGEADVLAIGCGDVDGDGGLELVIVTRTDVVVGRVAKDRFVTVQKTGWARLSPRAPTPLRDPIAAVVVAPPGHDGEIWLGSSDRGALVVDAALSPKRTLAGLPLEGGPCAAPAPDANALDGSLVDCETKTASLSPLPEARFDAGSFYTVRTPDGRGELLVAARSPLGKLRVGPEGAAPEALRTLEGIGADVAIGDLDLDGRPEIAFSAERGEESVTIATLTPTGLEQRWQLAAGEPVRALAMCPPEDRGAPALVAAVGDEVWIVR